MYLSRQKSDPDVAVSFATRSVQLPKRPQFHIMSVIKKDKSVASFGRNCIKFRPKPATD